jgi:hypothetical protein
LAYKNNDIEGEKMKKIITSLSSALLILAASLSLTGVAKSAEFFTIGTGGPTGVYFQTGNAICKMLHKSAIAKEHGRKKGYRQGLQMYSTFNRWIKL